MASMLDKSQVLRLAEQGKKVGCTEALIVTGERPEQKYSQVKEWLNKQGHSSTIQYIDEISSIILEETGLLPHTNAGNLTYKELSLLKKTNVSIGCMLESGSYRLMQNGMPHEFAPSKDPRARIKVLENAGKLRLPITTGILVGIGETMDEIIDSLFIIRDVNKKYGNIQEIIIQNFVPKYNTPMRNRIPPPWDYFLRAVCAARIILTEMNIQVPPNLNPNNFSKYIRAGINDWGGISPITIDHVNPESPWPNLVNLNNVTKLEGYSLRSRLPVYPEFLLHKREFIDTNMWRYIFPLIEDNGLVREAHAS
jgi:7,8-didemethyl-8-hydroxy-5-deazariboflavin synthase CofG subunit